MGKDGSGEPVPKKLKQSQLCFKSPKTNDSLKSKSKTSESPVSGGTVCKSEKHVVSEFVDLTEDSSSPIKGQLCNKSPKESDSLKSKTESTLSSGTCKSEKPVLSEIVDVVDENKSLSKGVKSISSFFEKTVRNNGGQKICPKETDKENSEMVAVVPEVGKSSDNGPSKDVDLSSMDVDCPVPTASSVQSCKSETASSGNKSDKPSNNNLPPSNVESMEVDLPQGVNDIKETVEDNSTVTPLKTQRKEKNKRKSDTSAASESEMFSSDRSIEVSSESDDESGMTSSSSTPVTPRTPSSQSKRMTPKMMKRHEESLKRKQIQQQLKDEKKARMELMKNEKLKRRQEEEEKRNQLKEEKKKKRLAEIELKNQEKRQKQEDKKMKREKEEEEKRKKKEQKEEEQKKKEEEQKKEEEKKEQEVKKKERAQAAFVSFFKKQSNSSPGGGSVSSSVSAVTGVVDSASQSNTSEKPAFMPFPLKSDMKLAELNRRKLSMTEKECLDAVLLCDKRGDSNRNYLSDLKQPDYTPRISCATWPAPVSEELHDCIIIEAQVEDPSDKNVDEVSESGKHAETTRRAKLLQFCENRRPAYFGTWTKRSNQVSGRTPFAKDGKGLLDYEVDSDSEWEEEEEGEDLDNMKDDENEGQEEETDGAGAGDAEDGYLLDNTFVPHGYLSDEEQPDEEQIHESVEKQKDRLVALKEEFDEEMKQGGAQALKPKLLGCLWVSNSTTQVSKGSLYEVLLAHRAVWDESENPSGIDIEPEPVTPAEKSPSQTPSSKQLPHLVLQEIARMVDGSHLPLSKLVREIGEVLSMARPQNPVSRLALTRAIKNMASKILDSQEKSVWMVKSEFRSEYDLCDLEEATPTPTASSSKGKNKETLLDNFLRANQNKSDVVGPPAKKRIALTPALPKEVKTDVTPTDKKQSEGNVPKKKVAFVTLPPRTPQTPINTSQKKRIPLTPGTALLEHSPPHTPWTSSSKQTSLKPHVDTPRPLTNRFLKQTPESTPESVESSKK